jgi:fermentation-respiration switch protein FrsA (DUF1100 family)
MKRRILWIGGILAVLAGGGYGGYESVQRGIVLYHPDPVLPTPVEAGVPDARPITIHTSDGLELTSWFQKPADDTKPVMLFFMGDTGALADRVADFAPYFKQGYGFLLLGYRGFGGNPGTPSEKGLYIDARAAVAWLQKNGYPLNRIVFYGHSLGTGIAVQMALEYPAYAVVLEAPYTTLPDTVTMDSKWLRSNWFMKDRYDNITKIGKIKIPLLIIQGTQDEVIPWAQGKALYKAAKGPKEAHFIPDAGHMNLYDFGEADLVMKFLEHPPEKESAVKK